MRMADVKRKLEEKGIKIETDEIGVRNKKYKDRLIIDLPMNVKPIIKRFYADEDGRVRIPDAYKNEVTYGENIKALAMVLYGQGVQSMNRIVELISALTGNIVKLSEGTISNWLMEVHKGSIKARQVIEEHLLDAVQVSTDGTVVTENGHQSYIRNFSIADWVLYVSMGSKGHKALSQIPFSQGARAIPDKTLKRLETRYDELLEYAKQERRDKPSGLRWATKEETALLNRLKEYKQNHLLFLHNYDVPFDNNMSERDLRKCKNRQKMSGGFRTELGKEIFCSLLTITETCKCQGKDLIIAFKTILSGAPLFA